MEWNREVVEKFISLYREQPCLWKIKSNVYKNKNLKNEAYDKLVAFCIENVTPTADKDFVIKKIQGLRGAFRKELRKVLGSMKSGSGSEDVYTPSLWYYNLLLFTKDQEVPSESLCNIEGFDDSCPAVEEFSANPSSQETGKDKQEQASETGTDGQEKSSRKDSKKRKKTSKENGHDDEVRKFMLTCQSALEQTRETSEFNAVGINVHKKLERMDPFQALHAERLINSVLLKGMFNELSSTTTLMDVPSSVNRSTPRVQFSFPEGGATEEVDTSSCVRERSSGESYLISDLNLPCDESVPNY